MEENCNIKEFYESIERLANSWDFHLTNSRANGSNHYIHFNTQGKGYRTGPFARMRLWEDNIVKPLYENVNKNNLEMELSNNFFGSKLRASDANANLYVWSPSLSTLFSPITGNRIKAKLEIKNK